MTYTLQLIPLLLMALGMTACEQTDLSNTTGRQNAEEELRSAFTDTLRHHIVLIKDSTTAVAVAEPILFGIYGKQHILDEKPYEIYHINNYWVLSGTLPKGMMGGTFLIILDENDSRVVKVTHGK